MSHDFKATTEAYQKFAAVLAELEVCKRLFEHAGEPLPEKLKEFFGTSRSNGRLRDTLVTISAPHRPSRPVGSADDWISVEMSEVTATALVLAVLREAGQAVPARDVVQRVAKINPKVPRGSVHNIGTRLDGTLIHRTEEGWSLIDATKAGVIHEGYLWGPKEIFDKTEIAAHRREAILNILKGFPSGLQTVQIVEQLKGASWVHAPANKDLVKADMELLEAHDKVRRSTNSRKWVVELKRD